MRYYLLLAIALLLIASGLIYRAIGTHGRAEFILFATVDPDGSVDKGSLFCLRDAHGTCLVGAGFEGGVNTGIAKNTNRLHFFFHDTTPPTLVDRGRPFNASSSVALIAHQDLLVALDRSYRELPRALRVPNGESWEAFPNPAGQDLENLLSTPRGPLFIGKQGLYLHDQRLLALDNQPGRYQIVYVDQLVVLFHLNDRELTAAAFPLTDLLANETARSDLRPHWRHVVTRESTIDAFTSTPDAVWFWSSAGHVYRYAKRERQFSLAHEGAPRYSNQVYATLPFEQTVLLGHYPSGNLLTFREGQVAAWAPVVPHTSDTNRHNREVQTLALHAGRLYAGVWPWGEVWDFQPGGKEWRLTARLFRHPAPDRLSAPYHSLAKERPGIAPDSLGQRVSGTATLHDRLFLATASKSRLGDFAAAGLSDPRRQAEYGRVFQLTGPDHLSCEIAPVAANVFRLAVENGVMSIHQNDTLLCARFTDQTPARIAKLLKRTAKEIGKGVYGPFRGSYLQVEKMGFFDSVKSGRGAVSTLPSP